MGNSEYSKKPEASWAGSRGHGFTGFFSQLNIYKKYKNFP
jgi:hypothetical protein